MRVTYRDSHPQRNADEAAVMLALLKDYPRGKPDLGIALELGLQDYYVYNILVNLRAFGLVSLDFIQQRAWYGYNYLTANGWLKAIMLERSRSSTG